MINEQVRPYGLTTLQYTTLSVLGARGGLSTRSFYPAVLTGPGRSVLAVCDEAVDAVEREMLSLGTLAAAAP